MRWIEKMIEAISPAWALRRKAAAEACRYYDAGERNRFSNLWTPVNVTDQENMDKTERALILARAQDLERNSDIANSIVNAFIRNVIGPGIKLQARTSSERTNIKIEEAFDEWSRGLCDITGQQNFYEMQAMMLRRKMVDGEVFCKFVNRGGNFSLQVIRAEMLDSSLMSAPNKNVIRSGIELNDVLRPVAYWVQKKDPEGYVTLEPERVPAEDMLHLWTRRYPDQLRGISDFAACLKRIRDLDEYLNAETIAAKIAASFCLLITQNTPGLPGSPNPRRDREGKPLERIRPGMIAHLAPGEDVKTANPSRSSTTAESFTSIHERLTGASLGISYEMISRDFNGSSYSAARQGNLEDRKTFQPVQQWMIQHFCQPVYEAFLDWAVLSGRVKIGSYWSRRKEWQRCEWVAPGWQSIDPLKEAQADVLSMQNGTLTMAQQCASHGVDWRDQLDQMAKEKAYAEEMGLILSIHTPESVQAASANHTEGENGNEQGEE